MSRSGARLLADLLDSTGDVKLENLDNIEDAVNGTAKRQSFTATAGQTTFNVAGGFDSGYVDVYMDGVKLHTSDFADTSGTAIVLVLGASENQLIDVIAYGTFTLSNLSIPDINTLQTSLDAKIDDAQVLTDVPVNALFTDTIYSKPSTEPISYISGLQTALNGKQASGSYEPADATILKAANIGTSANQIVKLDATAKLPAVDGSQLTNLAGGGATDINGLSDGVVTATGNIGLGANAVNSITTGDKNVGLGDEALTAVTSGEQNVALGYHALKTVSTGEANTAIGTNALAVCTGNSNIAIGTYAGKNVTTGGGNVIIGTGALYGAVTGANNISIGNSSMYWNTSGYENVAIGFSALNANTSARGNIAVGTNCMYSNTTGTWNSVLGFEALKANTTGQKNVALGYGAGDAITTGSNNTIIGDLPGSATLADTVLIGAGTTERLKVNSTGLYVNGVALASGMTIKTANGSSIAIGEAFLLSSTSSTPSTWSWNGSYFTVSAGGGNFIGFFDACKQNYTWKSGFVYHQDNSSASQIVYRWFITGSTVSSNNNLGSYLPALLIRIG